VAPGRCLDTHIVQNVAAPLPQHDTGKMFANINLKSTNTAINLNDVLAPYVGAKFLFLD
jgi:hypothetical protein